MATTTKLNIDKATVKQLFKAVIKATDEINEKSILYGQVKRVLPIKPLAQAAEFYVPNGNHDRIALTTNGHPDIRAWSDRELVNTTSLDRLHNWLKDASKTVFCCPLLLWHVSLMCRSARHRLS